MAMACPAYTHQAGCTSNARCGWNAVSKLCYETERSLRCRSSDDSDSCRRNTSGCRWRGYRGCVPGSVVCSDKPDASTCSRFSLCRWNGSVCETKPLKVWQIALIVIAGILLLIIIAAFPETRRKVVGI